MQHSQDALPRFTVQVILSGSMITIFFLSLGKSQTLIITPHILLADYYCKKKLIFYFPRLVRESIPEAVIGLFVHTPFPSSEVFRCLPSQYSFSSFDVIFFCTFDGWWDDASLRRWRYRFFGPNSLYFLIAYLELTTSAFLYFRTQRTFRWHARRKPRLLPSQFHLFCFFFFLFSTPI